MPYVKEMVLDWWMAAGNSYCLTLELLDTLIMPTKHSLCYSVQLFTPTKAGHTALFTSGLPGRNIPADFHLNRLCKNSISNLGANKTPSAIMRIGKSSQNLMEILGNFNATTGVAKESSAHTTRSMMNDLMKIINVLKELKVFSENLSRRHQSFVQICCNLFAKVNHKKFEKWLRTTDFNIKSLSYLQSCTINNSSTLLFVESYQGWGRCYNYT